MLENLEERLAKVPGGRYIASAVLLFLAGGIFHVFDLIEKIPDATLWLLKFLVAGEHASEIHREPSALGRAVVLIVYVLGVLVLCGFIFFHASWRQKMEARHARRYGRLFLRQAGDVYRWLATRDDLPFTESSVRRELTILKSYDVRFTDTSVYRADGVQLFAVAFEVVSDQPVEDSQYCDFRAKSKTADTNIICIPAEESATRSRFVAVFVPPIALDHPGVEVEVTALWPKAARSLQKASGHDLQTYRVKKRVRQPIDEVVFSVTVLLDGEFTFQHEITASDCTSCQGIKVHSKQYQVTARGLLPRADVSIRVARQSKNTSPRAGD